MLTEYAIIHITKIFFEYKKGVLNMLKPSPINLTDVKRRNLIHPGKINNVYSTDRPGIYEVESLDSLYVESSKKVENIAGKGIINNAISSKIFDELEMYGIPTNIASKGTAATSRFVLQTTPIPLKATAIFEARGNFCERYNCRPGITFDEPFIEFAYKNDTKGDQPIDHNTIAVFLKQYQLESEKEIYLLDYYTVRIAKILENFWHCFNVKAKGTASDFRGGAAFIST